MRKIQRLGLAIACILAMAGPASASLTISQIGTLNIDEGGTGFIDVRVTAEGGDFLESFTVEFEITTSSGHRLEFAQVGGIPPSAHLAAGDYVFAGVGSNGIGSTADLVDSGTLGNPNTYYLGTDFSSAGASGPFDRLLFRLELTALTDDAPEVGDQFLISIVNSRFDEAEDTEIFPMILGGETLVTITAPLAAVPEPSSLCLFGGGLLLLGVGRWRRRISLTSISKLAGVKAP